MLRCDHILDNGKRCSRIGERFCYQHLSLHFKDCTNSDDLSATEIKELFLKGEPIYRDKSNNCFSIEDLRGMLVNTKSNKNPYTGTELWKDEKEFEDIISVFDQKERDSIKEFYYPSGLSREVISALSRNLDIFYDIGMVGAILKADFTDEFKASTIAVNYLKERILKSRDSEILLSLSVPGQRQTNIKSIIENCASVCIHGIGASLINIYLYTRNHMPVKPPLAPAFIQTNVRSAVVFPYMRVSPARQMDLYIFKNDIDSSDIVTGNYWYYHYPTSKWGLANGHEYIASKIPLDTRIVITQSINLADSEVAALTALPSYILEHDLYPLF